MIVLVGRRLPPLVVGLIAVTVLTSIIAAVDAHNGGALYWRLALRPEDVWHGEVWRLVTWPFVEGRPLSLLFECLALYFFAPDLQARWGTARFTRFVAGIVVVAGAGTCLIALVLPTAWWFPQLGGLALGDAIVIAWALQFPDQPIRLYFLIVVRGRGVVQAVVGITALYGVFYGVTVVLPELLASAAALLYMDRPHLRWPRKRRRRSREGFGVIQGDRHGGPYYPN